MAIVQVTADDCKTIAESLREHLGRLGVRMNIRGELHEFLDDLTWLGTFAADTEQPRAAFEVDPARAARAFPRYEQALRIARAIVFIEDSPAARGRARLLKDRFDRLRSLAETSQDALFELEVAGRFLWKGSPSHSMSLILYCCQVPPLGSGSPASDRDTASASTIASVVPRSRYVDRLPA